MVLSSMLGVRGTVGLLLPMGVGELVVVICFLVQNMRIPYTVPTALLVSLFAASKHLLNDTFFCFCISPKTLVFLSV